MNTPGSQPDHTATDAKRATEHSGGGVRMPDRSERVRETIRRFESSSARPSSLMAMSDPDLFETGLLLTDRKLSIADALKQVNTMLGGTDEEPVVARSTFYVFADRFKSLYGQVGAEYARRLARLSIEQATDANIRSMTRLARHRLSELVAERLVQADEVEDIEKNLPKLAAALNDAEHVQLKADKLELERQQYERQMRETIAKLDLADKRAAEIEQRLTQAQARFDVELKQLTRKASGGKTEISDNDIAEARRLVFGS